MIALAPGFDDQHPPQKKKKRSVEQPVLNLWLREGQGDPDLLGMDIASSLNKGHLVKSFGCCCRALLEVLFPPMARATWQDGPWPGLTEVGWLCSYYGVLP